MSTDEFIKKQQDKLNELIKENKPLALAVKSVMALQADRIFIKGQNSEGGDIGDYGYNEVHINPKDSPKKFTPRGKNGKTRKKNGEPYKTGYFANWLEYKKTIGKNKNINTVDLYWRGELLRNWANSTSDGKALSNPNALKINANKYVVAISEYNANKVERYGLQRVFGVSKSEKEMFLKALNFEVNRFMSK